MEKELLCSPEMRKINLCLCVCGGGGRFCCCCHHHLALSEIHKDIILSVNLYVNFFFSGVIPDGRQYSCKGVGFGIRQTWSSLDSATAWLSDPIQVTYPL